MTLAPEIQSPPRKLQKDVIFPPSDLYSDEPPLESELNLRQIILLLQCLEQLAAKLREINLENPKESCA